MAKFLFEEEEEDEEEEEEEERKVSSSTPSLLRNNKHIYAERTPQKHAVHQLATPPYSVEYNNVKTLFNFIVYVRILIFICYFRLATRHLLHHDIPQPLNLL